MKLPADLSGQQMRKVLERVDFRFAGKKEAI